MSSYLQSVQPALLHLQSSEDKETLLLGCRSDAKHYPSLCTEADTSGASDESSIFEFSAFSSTGEHGRNCDSFARPLSAVITRYLSHNIPSLVTDAEESRSTDSKRDNCDCDILSCSPSRCSRSCLNNKPLASASNTEASTDSQTSWQDNNYNTGCREEHTNSSSLIECDNNDSVSRSINALINSKPWNNVEHSSEAVSPVMCSADSSINLNHNETNSRQNRQFEANSPILFFEDDDYENQLSNEKPTLCVDNSRIIAIEKRRLKQIQECLVGVVPPPSVTIPQLGVNEILTLLKQNDQLLYYKNMVQEDSTALKNQAIESSWPEVKACCYFGVHYNNGTDSELLETLGQRFSARFVGSETASSCTVWANSSVGGSFKNKRGAGPSPGRRLSYLARRRRAFSRDNLLSNAASNHQSSALERRQIVVHHKKLGNAQGRNGKLPDTTLSHKRALFQSPDQSRKKLPGTKSSSSSKKKARCPKPVGSSQSFKRALFSSGTQDKDKAGTSSWSEPGSSKRSLECPSGSTSLSSPHKKKLLWAVAEALRGLGIGLCHSLFRPCAATLARLCRQQLANISLAGSTSTTTEVMTQLANQHVAQVVKEKTANS